VRAAVAASATAAVATAVIAGLPSSDSERASAKDVLLGAAAVAAEQPETSGRYRYTKLVRRSMRSSMVRGCTTCVGSVTAEQEVEQWTPRDWRDGRRRYGDVRIVERSGDPERVRELTEGPFFDSPRLAANPVLQDIPFAELPTEPLALRDLLQAATRDLRWAGRARAAIEFERNAGIGKGRERFELINGIVSILADANISPSLRATFFRVLATVDGARALGQVTDPLGRTGQGVAFDDDIEDTAMDYPAVELRIFVNPDTAELLAVSRAQRDPNERPVPKAGFRDDEIGWGSAWTAYVRTGDVAKVGERP
jgi:hypothetical protein